MLIVNKKVGPISLLVVFVAKVGKHVIKWGQIKSRLFITQSQQIRPFFGVVWYDVQGGLNPKV